MRVQVMRGVVRRDVTGMAIGQDQPVVISSI